MRRDHNALLRKESNQRAHIARLSSNINDHQPVREVATDEGLKHYPMPQDVHKSAFPQLVQLGTNNF
jgi:hypothetical protein